jgi:hypothetical protein
MQEAADDEHNAALRNAVTKRNAATKQTDQPVTMKVTTGRRRGSSPGSQSGRNAEL